MVPSGTVTSVTKEASLVQPGGFVGGRVGAMGVSTRVETAVGPLGAVVMVGTGKVDVAGGWVAVGVTCPPQAESTTAIKIKIYRGLDIIFSPISATRVAVKKMLQVIKL